MGIKNINALLQIKKTNEYLLIFKVHLDSLFLLKK
jgi:hypothetical protein